MKKNKNNDNNYYYNNYYHYFFIVLKKYVSCVQKARIHIEHVYILLNIL